MQAVIKENGALLEEENIFHAFLFYFEECCACGAGRTPPSSLLARLFERLVNCWQGRRLGQARLEERLLAVINTSQEPSSFLPLP
jgi:hypothetical protein